MAHVSANTCARVELAIDPPRRDRWDFLAQRAGMTRTGFLRLAVELTDAVLSSDKTEQQRVLALLTRPQNEERPPTSNRRALGICDDLPTEEPEAHPTETRRKTSA